MRYLKILEYTLSVLVRRKAKTSALIIVYAFTIAALGSVLFLTHALKSEAVRSLSSAPEIVVQMVAAGRHELISTDAVDIISTLPGVKQVKARVWGYYYDSLIKANLTLLGWSGGDTDLALLTGHMPQADDECAIGAGVSKVFGPGIGDLLVLEDAPKKRRTYRITGTFSSSSSLLTNDLAILTEPALRDFFSMPGHLATDLAVEVYNPREIKTLAKKINYYLPGSRPITRDEIRHTYESLFNWRSGMMLVVSVAALLAFCILAWDKATGMSADEKQEIGILKAIGWETADILLVKFWEGLVISSSAFFIGILLAWVHVFVFSAPLLTPLLKGWSVLFPEFSLIPDIDLYQLFVLAVLTITPYLACTLVPSWRTATTAPDQVMRG